MHACNEFSDPFLAKFWDTHPTTGPHDSWTIHGKPIINVKHLKPISLTYTLPFFTGLWPNKCVINCFFLTTTDELNRVCGDALLAVTEPTAKNVIHPAITLISVLFVFSFGNLLQRLLILISSC